MGIIIGEILIKTKEIANVEGKIKNGEFFNLYSSCLSVENLSELVDLHILSFLKNLLFWLSQTLLDIR